MPKSLLAMVSLAIAKRCQDVVEYLASLVLKDFEESEYESDEEEGSESEEEDDEEDDEEEFDD